MAAHPRLAVCDLFVHSAELLPALASAAPGILARPTADDPVPRPTSRLSLAVRFDGTAVPVPSVLLPLDDALSLHDDVALRLGRSVTSRLDKGKSVCLPFGAQPTRRS
jgi:hypothetical protein